MNTTDDLSKLLEAERQAAVPSAAVERGWQRLAVDLAANVAPLPVASGPIKLGLAVFPKWLLAGFTLGLAGAGATASVWPQRAEFDGGPADVARVAPVALTRASTAEEAAPPPAAAPERPRTPPEQARAWAAPSAPTSVTFDAELKLISLAKSELDAHRPAQARAWLAEHAEQFPHGVFAVERDALGVLASCEQGPKSPGLARKFAEQHPGSPLVERLERACSDPIVAEKPRLSASVDFSKLPNGSPELGERTAEPDGGEQP
jgi:hypothetical protein